MPETILQVNDLVKDYKTGFFGKNIRVLKGVSFAVEKGEIFGFVGPSGAGKTTTIKSILGLVKPTEGTIEIAGNNLNHHEEKRTIGYLPENPYFYDYLTGEELLFYMGELHGIKRSVLSDRAGEVLEKVRMTQSKGVQLRQYSKEMLQRIGLAQALINDPELIILDEPMCGFDPVGWREIKGLMLEEKRKGKTILLSSHILSDVEALCDRVGIIIEGKVVKTDNIADLLKDIHTEYEMLLEGPLEDVRQAVKGLSIELESRAGYTALKFDDDTKRRVVSAVADSSAEIVSLNPLRKSLEELFAEKSNKYPARGQKKLQQ